MFASQAIFFTTAFLSATVVLATPLPTSHNTTHHALATRGTGEHNGIASWYDPEGAFGACGWTIQNSDKALALSTDEWQGGALCGKSIIVTNKANGQSVGGVIVADLCPGCEPRDGNKNNVDLTEGVFSQIADLGTGLIDVVWYFQD